MRILNSLLPTSIGKKQLVALSGLAISGFTAIHMSGNLLMFLGPEAYNSYGHQMTHSPIYYPIEAGLITVFAIHLWVALRLNWENKKARPVKPYQLATSPGRRASFASRSMVYTGLLLLVFLVLHLITFRFGTYYPVSYHGVEMRDLYRLAVEKFHDPVYIAWYLFSMVILGIHLSHGIASTFQTLGFSSVKRIPVRNLGWTFAAVVALGFCSQPIYIFLSGGK